MKCLKMSGMRGPKAGIGTEAPLTSPSSPTAGET